MKGLPAGRKSKRLGDLIILHYGKGLRQSDRRGGKIPVYGSNGIVGYHDEAFVNRDTIIVGRKGSVGEVHLALGRSWPIDTTYYVEVTDDLFLLYAYRLLKFLKLGSVATSTAIPGINRNDVYKIDVTVPPLPIQKQIVVILEKASKLREKREEANEKTNQILQAVFLDMFGDPIKNDKSLPRRMLIDFADKGQHSFKRGPFGGALKKEIFVSEGYKVYEQKHAISDNFDIGSYYIMKEKYEEMLSFAVQPDDLIISCSGTIGRIAIVPEDAKEGIINQALLKITPDRDVVLPLFFRYLLESTPVQRAIFGKIHGSGIKNMAPMKTIKSTLLLCPSLEEQKKFVAVVKKVQLTKEKQSQSTEEINTLFDALMQKAFKGELVESS